MYLPEKYLSRSMNKCAIKIVKSRYLDIFNLLPLWGQCKLNPTFFYEIASSRVEKSHFLILVHYNLRALYYYPHLMI